MGACHGLEQVIFIVLRSRVPLAQPAPRLFCTVTHVRML
jgi:hypothetical protein